MCKYVVVVAVVLLILVVWSRIKISKCYVSEVFLPWNILRIYDCVFRLQDILSVYVLFEWKIQGMMFGIDDV